MSFAPDGEEEPNGGQFAGDGDEVGRAQAEYEIFARMKELTADKTALFISHRFSTVRLADRIMVLEGGAIIEHGTHDELLLQDGRYAELFNLQAASYR